MARPLHEIADDITRDWRSPYFGAVPYIQAMRTMDKITDPYLYDNGDDVVAYFLANARTWRGSVARSVKAELNAMLREGS